MDILQPNLVHIGVNQINPAPYNPRKDLQPGDPEYEALARSIETYGYVEPLVWNKRSGNLVGGHQRLKVLVARGLTEVAVVPVDLSPDQEKALNIALNKVGGDWDESKLATLLQELCSSNEVGILDTGFAMDEVQDLIDRLLQPDGEGAGDPDAAGEVDTSGPAVTQPGDLIELGGHRLLCGDSTNVADVRRLMDGKKAALVATDPPYLVGYDGTNRPGEQAPSPAGEKVTWDDPNAQEHLFRNFCVLGVAEAAKPNAAFYCFHASRNQALLESAWTAAGLFVHQQIIWVKDRSIPGRSWYQWQHEPCFFGWVRPHKPPGISADTLSTVWNLPTPAGDERPDHPTPKPVEVFCIPMRQHTVAGDICYEPFAGSGTQIIAAEKLGRRCFAMERDPRYCDLIVRRYIKYVGADKVSPELVERYAVKEVANVIA